MMIYSLIAGHSFLRDLHGTTLAEKSCRLCLEFKSKHNAEAICTGWVYRPGLTHQQVVEAVEIELERGVIRPYTNILLVSLDNSLANDCPRPRSPDYWVDRILNEADRVFLFPEVKEVAISPAHPRGKNKWLQGCALEDYNCLIEQVNAGLRSAARGSSSLEILPDIHHQGTRDGVHLDHSGIHVQQDMFCQLFSRWCRP